MIEVHDAELLLLADTSVIINFVEAGQAHVEALQRMGGTSFFITSGVMRELKRKRELFPLLRGVVRNWPENQIRRLPGHVEQLVSDQLEILNEWGDFPDEHRGEVETVFYADDQLTNGNERYRILMDDGDGRALAEDKFELRRTREIVCEVVAAGFLTVEQGWRVCVCADRFPDRTAYEALLTDLGAQV